MNSNKETQLALASGCVIGIGIVVFGFLLAVLAYLIKGLVLVQLWNMFISPNFDLPEISVGLSIGLALIIALLFSKVEAYRSKDQEPQTILVIFHAMITPFIILGLAYITKWFFVL